MGKFTPDPRSFKKIIIGCNSKINYFRLENTKIRVTPGYNFKTDFLFFAKHICELWTVRPVPIKRVLK